MEPAPTRKFDCQAGQLKKNRKKLASPPSKNTCSTRLIRYRVTYRPAITERDSIAISPAAARETESVRGGESAGADPAHFEKDERTSMNMLQIQNRRTADLIPYARNPRVNDHAVDRMAACIREFGFKIPILARSDGEVIDGHLRLKAGLKLGLEHVPVVLCDDWTAAQVKAFRLLVNRSATWADWDEELLSLELADLQELDFDLALTGFDSRELDEYLHALAPDDTSADAIPEIPDQPASQRGDVWRCGDHRVICGDATDSDCVARLLGGSIPVVMITDPPYGVDYDPMWRERAGLGTVRQTGQVVNDHRADWEAAYALFGGDIAYVWHAGIHAAEVARGLESAQFQLRGQIIWAKQHFALSRGHYHWQHEPCWYAVRRGGNARWRGDRKQSTLWQIANRNPFGGEEEQEAATGHGTQKPVEIMRRPILNHTQGRDVIYDPFLGSGTVLIAAEMTGRICYGVEIEPCYVDMVIRRWQEFSKQAAVLENDGRSFSQVEAEAKIGAGILTGIQKD
jgi:DNA modification methylase